MRTCRNLNRDIESVPEADMVWDCAEGGLKEPHTWIRHLDAD
jgi:hypothetical protein